MFKQFSIDAQENFRRDTQVEVYNLSNSILKNAWVGGFNHLQYSEVDLNLDGKNDLIVFDRSGNRISPFINQGSFGVIDYSYAPEYIDSLPKFNSWVLFRDYNCDGKQDIFAYSTGGMAVYKNTSQNSLSFELVTNLLTSDYTPDDANDNFINLYISATDIPAIDDIDNDGDLDVLTFSILGTYVEYHKNLSVETYGTCDSLRFYLSNKCWGFFSENLSNNSVTMYDTCDFNVAIPEKVISDAIFDDKKKHSGSSLLTLDVDSNNTKDLVLGDLSFGNLTLLYNSDNTNELEASSITQQDQLFPSNNLNTVAVDLEIFPAGFYLDLNNDNIKDLVVTTNCNSGCENYKSSWLYINNGSTNHPNFSFQKNNFLQDEMIEIGEGALPEFFDYDGDGLMDLIVGNYGKFDNSLVNLYSSSLTLYKNIGTLSNPKFKLINNDFAGISTMNLDLNGSSPTLGLKPTFGDLDGDGDEDMMLGDYLGNIHYFTNTAGIGNPANFVLNQVKYQNIDVGSFASPQLIDLNRDGKLDLVIGKNNGYFSYYENTGTLSSPLHVKKTDSLGYASTLEFGFFQGNSIPYIYEDGGEYKMIAGSLSGYLYRFDNIEGNLTGTFNKVDSTFINIDEGKNSAPTIADINNDGYLDMIIGNYAGGLSYYKGTQFPVSVQERDLLKGVKVYPNPTKDIINIELANNELNQVQIELIDLLGKVNYQKNTQQNKIQLSLNNYPQGIYLIKVVSNQGSKVFKIVKE